VLSKDADASVVGAGSLKDSKSDADAGTVAGAGETAAAAEASGAGAVGTDWARSPGAAGIWGAAEIGGSGGA
jgi:hypothetical protein